MTPHEYKQHLKTLGIGQKAFARWVGNQEQSGKRWAQRGPPPSIGKLLRLVTAMRLTPTEVDEIIKRA